MQSKQLDIFYSIKEWESGIINILYNGELFHWDIIVKEWDEVMYHLLMAIEYHIKNIDDKEFEEFKSVYVTNTFWLTISLAPKEQVKELLKWFTIEFIPNNKNIWQQSENVM